MRRIAACLSHRCRCEHPSLDLLRICARWQRRVVVVREAGWNNGTAALGLCGGGGGGSWCRPGSSNQQGREFLPKTALTAKKKERLYLIRYLPGGYLACSRVFAGVRPGLFSALVACLAPRLGTLAWAVGAADKCRRCSHTQTLRYQPNEASAQVRFSGGYSQQGCSQRCSLAYLT